MKPIKPLKRPVTAQLDRGPSSSGADGQTVGPVRREADTAATRGADRDRTCPAIPTIGNGMDVKALAKILMKQLQQGLADHGFTPAAFNVDKDEMNRLLAGIRSSRMRGSDDEDRR